MITAGAGYRYLLNSVVIGDGDRDAAAALTRYYLETGTPPGRWLGAGLPGLAGEITAGTEVSEDQLTHLIGHGKDPNTGEPLGRPYRRYATAAKRIRRRIDRLPETLTESERELHSVLISAEESAKPVSAPVAAFDLTFSVPKSVSTLWAVADGGTQALIAGAHHEAIRDTLDLIEREVAMTRVGALGPRGAVAQVEVRGVLAAAYDHWDSRSQDPQLHTHVVVANRVQAREDGKWRTLDSRALHQAVTGLSEHYNALLSDAITRTVGVGWEARERGAGRSTAWEIAGVRQEVMDEFSSRTRDIELVKDRLVAEYVATHGRQPSARLIWQFRQQATLETRPPKELVSLHDLAEQWRQRATRLLGEDAPRWAAVLIASAGGEPLLRADDLPLELLDDIAETVVAAVGDRRATWKRWHLHAETVRQTMPFRFASAADRERVIEAIVAEALRCSVRLSPPELATSPIRFRRPDGSSVFRPKHGLVFTSELVLAAEDRLLAASHDRTGPVVPLSYIEHAAQHPPHSSHALSPDQEAAIAKIGVSGKALDLLVGPAGAGKTTTMLALRLAWERRHGAGSVVGLAPSAAAADVLAQDLKITTENTAKWRHEHQQHRWDFSAGQLIIVDEASLGGTFTLDLITAHARDVGAKVLLVGDSMQLGAVETGGAFGMLVTEHGLDTPELTDVRRFRHPWEKAASLSLRVGDTDVIDTYLAHGRVHGAGYLDTLNAAYQAWQADRAAGKRTVLIAETSETVTELNARARTDRILAGEVAATGLRLTEGLEVSAGDIVITRQNDRRLAVGRGWVKNGDRWTVLNTHTDGSITLRREKSRWYPTIRLPAWYVTEHLDLGYAITAHRAQGVTMDTAHAVIHSPEATQEALYVAMTRGKEANHVYVATGQYHLEEHQQRDDLRNTARSILYGILQHVGAELSAHDTIVDEQDTWSSLQQLGAEYETIAQVAQQDRWLELCAHGGLTSRQIDELAEGDSFGILTIELRRLEAAGHDIERLLPRVIAAGRLEDVDDLGSLIRWRIQRLTAHTQPSPRHAAGLIAGLIPRAAGTMAPEMRQALEERQRLIEDRVASRTHAALEKPEPWMVGLEIDVDDTDAAADLAVVIAYRDRWGITASSPLGTYPDDDAHRVDYARAHTHLASLSAAPNIHLQGQRDAPEQRPEL